MSGNGSLNEKHAHNNSSVTSSTLHQCASVILRTDSRTCTTDDSAIHDSLMHFTHISIRMSAASDEVARTSDDSSHVFTVSTSSSSVISLSFLCSLPNLEVLDLSHPSLSCVVRIDGNLCCKCKNLRRVIATGLSNVVHVSGSVLCGLSFSATSFIDGLPSPPPAACGDEQVTPCDDFVPDSNGSLMLEGMTRLREIGGDLLCHLGKPRDLGSHVYLSLPSIAPLPALRILHGSLLCELSLEGVSNLPKLDRFFVGGLPNGAGPILTALEIIEGDLFCQNIVSGCFPGNQGVSLTFYLPSLQTIRKSFLSYCRLPNGGVGDHSLICFQMMSLQNIGENFCVQLLLDLPRSVACNAEDKVSDDNCCLFSFKGLVNLELIGGSFLSLCEGIPTNISFEGLGNLKKVSASFLEKVFLRCPDWNRSLPVMVSGYSLLMSFVGLSALRVTGKFLVSCRLHGPTSQQVTISTKGLEALAAVKGSIFCSNMFIVETICFGGLSSLVEVGGSLLERMTITGKIRFEGACRLKSIGGNFLFANTSLPELVSFDGLSALDVVEGGFIRGTRTSPKTSISFSGLRSLRSVGCLLISCSFESVDFEGLSALDEVKGRFFEDCVIARSVFVRGLSSLRSVPAFPFQCTFGGAAPQQKFSSSALPLLNTVASSQHVDPMAADISSARHAKPPVIRAESHHQHEKLPSVVCIVGGGNSSAALRKLCFASCNLPLLDFVVDIEL